MDKYLPSPGSIDAAIKTLEQLGYAYQGGELWQPTLVDVTCIEECPAPRMMLTTNGRNVYEVIERAPRMLKLKCVYFHRKEDLGDKIFCDKLNQETWVAEFHVGRLKYI